MTLTIDANQNADGPNEFAFGSPESVTLKRKDHSSWILTIDGVTVLLVSSFEGDPPHRLSARVVSLAPMTDARFPNSATG